MPTFRVRMQLLQTKNLIARPLEAVVGLYALVVGLLFLIYPQSLDPKVYAGWQELGPHLWGLGLCAVALMHFAALFVNGAAPQLSRPVRLAAVFMHLGVSLQFAQMFLQAGAPWGFITYGLFLPSVLCLIASRVMRRFLHGGNVYEL